MRLSRTLPFLLAALVALPGCASMGSFGDNVGACGSEIGIGTIAGLSVAVLGANEVLGDSASTRARGGLYAGGALAGAAVGYAACVRANQHRRDVEARFAALEAQLSAQQAPLTSTVDASPGSSGTPPPTQTQQVTYTVELVDRSATKVELGGLLFETGQAELSEPGRLYLQIYAETMAPDMALVVKGHTDDVGSEDTNLALSQRRAEAVAAVLVGAGLPASRVEALGFGESEPLPGGTREQNRRVELWMIPQQTTTTT